MSRLRYAILALTLLAGLAGAACSDDSDPEEAATSTTTTEATSRPAATATTSSPTTVTTVAPPDLPPELIQTGDDLVAVVQSIHTWSQWLSTAPDPALLLQITDPGTTAYAKLLPPLEALVAEGYRWDGPQERLTDIAFESRPLPNIATVIATASGIEGAQLLDMNDNVVQTVTNLPPPARLVYSVYRDPSGVWRLNDFEMVGTP